MIYAHHERPRAYRHMFLPADPEWPAMAAVKLAPTPGWTSPSRAAESPNSSRHTTSRAPLDTAPATGITRPKPTVMGQPRARPVGRPQPPTDPAATGRPPLQTATTADPSRPSREADPRPGQPSPVPEPQTSTDSGAAGRLSMKELTEKTARPGPGGPYPGGEERPKSSMVWR